MQYREATKADIPQIQIVRNSVTENTLSEPGLVTDADCEEFMFTRGKGWVCAIGNKIVGFAIADLVDNNIWALFLLPEYENQGIGKKLHHLMLNWYFNQTKKTVWLGTDFNTRAEKFYKRLGWVVAEKRGELELRLEMTCNL